MEGYRPLLTVKDMSKIYHKREVEIRALDQANLEVRRGEWITLWGPSGSGKSTFLYLLGTLLQPEEGSYRFENEMLAGTESLGYLSSTNDKKLSAFRAEKIGFIFQDYNLLEDKTALENVMQPAKYVTKLKPQKEVQERAMELLRQVDLGDRMQHFPGELSGGQEQRVAIARAMMNQPSLLLADEPTGNLDSANHKMVLDLMQKLNREGMTVIVASHNPEVAEIADRVVKLKDGKIEEVEVNMK